MAHLTPRIHPSSELARRVRRRGLSVLVFTGCELDELRSSAALGLLAETDVLVSGRFLLGERDISLESLWPSPPTAWLAPQKRSHERLRFKSNWVLQAPAKVKAP